MAKFARLVREMPLCQSASSTKPSLVCGLEIIQVNPDIRRPFYTIIAIVNWQRHVLRRVVLHAEILDVCIGPQNCCAFSRAHQQTALILILVSDVFPFWSILPVAGSTADRSCVGEVRVPAVP